MNIKRIILEEITRSITEGIEHVQNLYKSWANKKSGNPEAAMKIMDDVINNIKKLPKKDFAAYTSYEELLTDLNKIKQESKSEDVTKIYEDKDLLVMAANTWEASCKYGAGTKWCTTARDTNSYWKRHNEMGTEFFWIFKNKAQNDPNHKFSYHINIKGWTDWCNAINNCKSELPENSYPKQHPMYGEIISKLQDFHNQRDFTKITKEREINQTEVINWVEDHIVDILEGYNITEHYDYQFSNEIDEFLFNGINNIVPLNADLGDSEYIDVFKDDLTNYLENFNPPFDLIDFIERTDIINDLTYVIGGITNVSEYISDGSLMDVLIDQSDENYEEYWAVMQEIVEVINENLGIYCSDLIGRVTSNFAVNY